MMCMSKSSDGHAGMPSSASTLIDEYIAQRGRYSTFVEDMQRLFTRLCSEQQIVAELSGRAKDPESLR